MEHGFIPRRLWCFDHGPQDEEIIERKGMMSVDKKETLEKLKNSEAVYVLLSGGTNLPFVECDPDTYDDQVLVFYKEEEARAKMAALTEEKHPVRIIKVEKKNFLTFYMSLYPMGVNCIVTDDGTSKRMAVQLNELISRNSPQKLPKGQVWVENPALNLTAIYFMQELHRNRGQAMTEEMKELYEEMMAHLGRGKYIFAVGKDQGIPALKGKDGQLYQPLFTDIQEFGKFNRQNQLRAMVVDADKIPNLLPDGSAGIVINPLGVNVQFKMRKTSQNQ